ncbi:MAG: anthranilate synthase component I family protein [Candidatus Hadarchaeales archaeon]
MQKQVEKLENIAREIGTPCILPVSIKINGCKDPAEIYFRIRSLHHPSFLFESSGGPIKIGRYSVIGFDPIFHFCVEGKTRRAILKGETFGRPAGDADPLEILKKVAGVDEVKTPHVTPQYLLAFFGCVGYDYVREMVPLPENAVDDLAHPMLEFILPSKIMIFDHLRSKTTFACLLPISDVREIRNKTDEARKAISRMVAILGKKPREDNTVKHERSNISRRDFERKVERAKEYIRAGDVIQVVLSRRIEIRPAPDPENFYWKLRSINPSPYMFFLDFPKRVLIGSSPELLVKVDDGKVVTRPIAGTRRRGDEGTDVELERDLLSSEKERAEHVMLVDLGRNDLGKVCTFGSVMVEEFMKVEKYSHVQHLVSTVSGQLRPDKDSFDALRVTFPAGTVTGAPKVRAMEIIEELEPTRRGLYAGAVGCFSYQREADFAITIRAMVIQNGTGYIQVGAGIVADSVAWKEYYETENKARALLAAAGVRS